MSANDHSVGRAQLRALMRIMTSNPTLDTLSPEARAGYFAAISTLDCLSEGMPARYVADGIPSLLGCVDAALVEGMWAGRPDENEAGE